MPAIAAPSAPRLGLADVARACRLLGAMPGFLRRPLREAEAVAVLRRRLQARPAAFLDTIRRALHGHPASPYPRLLAMAGCEQGDVARLVERDGIEATLTALARAGVYLTVDELKGRRPVLRGSAGFEVDPAGLVSPDVPSHLVYRTSGSRGPGAAVSLDLGYYRERAVNLALCLGARGGRAWRHAMWLVPGGAASIVLLPYAALGYPLSAWFSPVEAGSTAVDWRYGWSERVLRWGGRLGGISFPRPVHVPLTQPLAVARWMRACLDAGQVPHLLVFPSAAAGLCRAAVAAGIDLAGARLSLGGEPVTDARMAEVKAAGALALPHYGSMETGFIGEGCLAPEAVDEIHLFDDLHAVVQAGPVAALPPRALLVSSLAPTAPLVLLNVSLGDEAGLSQRRCGCPLEATGWTTHLHTIRSHEKLTAGGMTILDADAVTALEEVLPARFGGAATDYQLLEREDARGRPRLVLVVSPRVGAVDEGAVAAAFLGAIGADSGASRIAALLWREAGVVRVERRPPVAGPTGKVLHLHVDHPGGPPGR